MLRFFALLLLLAVCVTGSPLGYAAPSDQADRIAGSFLLTYGRLPAPDEQAAWLQKGGTLPAAQLLSQMRQALSTDAAAQAQVSAKAAADVLGPQAATSKGSAPAGSYAEQVKHWLHWLGSHAAEYDRSIHAAYRETIGRDAFPEELAYWKEIGVVPHVLLLSGSDAWARRNLPGLTVTSGTASASIHSPYLQTVRLQPAVSAEFSAALGLVTTEDAPLAVAAGRTIVMPGAEKITSLGGIHFAAAGTAPQR